MRLILLCRLGWAAGWGGGRQERWRASVIAAAAAVVVTVACGATSAWLMSQRINERVGARNFAPATGTDDVVYERHVMYDQLPSGESVLVAWWRLAPGAPPLPGVPPDAKSGWFVSPELATRLAADPAIAQRYPNATVLDVEGVGSAEELVAYRLVSDTDVEMTEKMTATPYDYLGDNAELELLPVVLAAVGLVGIPGVGMLSGALSISTRHRHRRTSLLRFLGASNRTTATLRFVEAVAAAAPGALAASIVWTIASPRMTRVAVVGRRCLVGDLAIGWGRAAAIAVVVLATTGMAAVASRGGRAGNRPAALVPQQPHRGRIVPLSAGLAVLALSATAAGGSTQPKLFLVGVVIVLAGLPFALPLVTYRLGELLATTWGRHDAVALLTGRSLSLQAHNSASSVGALLAITALAPISASWVGVARDIDPRPDGASFYSVSGLNPGQAGDLADTYGVPILTLAAEPDDNGRFPAVGDCDDLAQGLGGIACRDGQFSGPVPGLPLVELFAAPPSGFTPGVTLFLIAPGSRADNALRSLALNAPQPGINVNGGAGKLESPLVAWILGAARIALAMAGFAVAAHLMAQGQRTAKSRDRLGAAGATHGVVRRIAAREAGCTIAAAGITGLLAGIAIAANFDFLEPSARFPWAAIAMAAVAITVLVALTIAAAWTSAPDPAQLWSERNHTGW